MFGKMITHLERGLERITGLLCIILLLSLFVEVMNRYLFFVSWPEIQFLIPFSFLWMCMFGSALAVRRGQHFEVDLLHKLFQGRFREAHRILMGLIMLAGGLLIVWSSVHFVELGLLKKNPATGIRMIYIYSSILAGGGLIALLAAERLLHGNKGDAA
jgi:TRAP-type C4-dicarboxylate transport system permease small subunit|tara:strand:- start:9161 stop:9634 length:474 start_codon:yes stop_codon:yes gene_type:complete